MTLLEMKEKVYRLIEELSDTAPEPTPEPSDDVENERLIRNGEIAYSYENTMYGTLGPERTVWNDEANGAMKEVVKKQESIKKKKKK